ncbi:hypothetical protein ACR30L_10705 [Psychromonas sp. PT13]|uniref:hypothetical protein n=1 Tax=Psychromonas sp. PT13 TaxID=3439547 RepID=UPI003EB7EC4E
MFEESKVLQQKYNKNKLRGLINVFRKLNISIIPIAVFIFLAAGVLQYLPVAIENLLLGKVVFWTLSSESLSNAGILKYFKDIFLLLFGLYWIYWCSNRPLGRIPSLIIKIYFYWISTVFAIGCIGYALGFSPLFFFKAGARWLVLFHAAVGFFVMSATSVVGKDDHKIIYSYILILLLCDALAVFLQLQLVGFSSLGNFRASGLFSNAALAGTLGVSAALISLVYLKVDLIKKLLLLSLALFIAVGSGSRMAMISIFLCFLFAFYDFIKKNIKGSYRAATFSFAIPTSILGTGLLYLFMIESVARGGIFDTQVGDGGRISNFFYYFQVLFESDLLEFFIGRGIGIGTNTAFSLVTDMGQIPASYRYNWLVDNTILTLFFQVGFLGSMVFWSGILLFLNIIRSHTSSLYYRYYLLVTFIFVLTIFTINLFEQYYLIISYLFIYGVIYNDSKFIKEAK